MKCCRAYVCIIKDKTSCTWDILCITPNICQAAASREGTVADAGHTVSNGDGGQSAATIEGPVAYAGHIIGDGDRGQAAAL